MQLDATNALEQQLQQEEDLIQNVPEIEIIEDDQHDEEDDGSRDYSDSDDYDPNDIQKEDNRFKDGESISMIRVRFPGNAKSFAFLMGKRKFGYGQKVVAMSDRGMTVGYINSFPYMIPFNKSMLPLRSIAKVATQEDIKIQAEFRDSEKKAEIICLHLIEKYELDMVLTHVEFTQFGKKAVFYFNAPARVDFRDLVKELVSELKMRIELRQISVRDRAAAIGAIGACGLQTCCSSFLKNYGNVSIKMAKNQNLALMASKLNGVCGQIKCCIKYEDEVYTDKRKHLPKEGSFILTKNGDSGKVLKLHILIEQFDMLTDKGAKRSYAGNQFHPKHSELPSDYKFPTTFDHITNETSNVIGLEEQKAASIVTIDVALNQQATQAIKDNKDVEEIDKITDVLGDDQAPRKEKQHTHPRPPRPASNRPNPAPQQAQAVDETTGEVKPKSRSRNKNRNRNRNKNRSVSNSEGNPPTNNGPKE